ncbi:MAG TPA: hypothetical protein VIL97_06235 [Thermoanaerobaculia bacterium]
MHQYAPPAQREVGADLYTTVGWITGSFMVPSMRNLTDFANQQHDFFKLKDVKLPGVPNIIPFFVLQRRSVVIAIPHVAEPSAKAAIGSEKETKDVSCAFHGGVVSGTLTVAKGLRVSDVVLQRDPFFYLTDCSLFLRTSGTPDIRKDLEMVVVNRWDIAGVSEPRFI